ncbi:MAG: hypothetical protein ACI8V7_000141 [Candidatus Paceibacteria bacterium]|jgi:hypothetical protein
MEKYVKNPFLNSSNLNLSEKDISILNSYTEFDTIDNFAEKYCEEKEISKYLHILLYSKKYTHLLIAKIARLLLSKMVPVNKQVVDSVKKKLEEFRDEEYLVSDKEVETIVYKEKIEQEKEKQKIDYICIPTANRPDSLKEVLESFLSFEKSKDYSFIISDDSTDEKIKSKTIQILKSFRNRFNKIYYIDEKIRSEAVKNIHTKIKSNKEIIEFGLLKHKDIFSVGASRNFLTLATAGKKIVEIDDDVMSGDIRSFAKKDDVRCTYQYPFQQKRFSKLEDIKGEKIKKDFLEIYERVLSEKPSSIIKKDNFVLESLNQNSLKSLLEGRATIKLATMGHFGDSATNSQDLFLKTNYKESDHISKLSDKEYLRLRNAEYFVNQSKTDLLYSGSSFVSLNFALDNRQISPFFSPLGRGDEITFLSSFEFCHFENIQYYLKECILHKRPDGKNLLKTKIEKSKVYPPLLIHSLITNSSSEIFEYDSTEKERYIKIGQYLEDIGKMNTDNFKKNLLPAYKKIISSLYYFTDLAFFLNKDCNKSYKKDLKKDYKNLSKFNTDELKVGWHEKSENMGIYEIRDLILKFGKFYKIWPQMWELSKEGEIKFMREI